MVEANLKNEIRYTNESVNSGGSTVSCFDVLENLKNMHGNDSVKFIGVVGNELLVSIKFDEY